MSNTEGNDIENSQEFDVNFDTCSNQSFRSFDVGVENNSQIEDKPIDCAQLRLIDEDI